MNNINNNKSNSNKNSNKVKRPANPKYIPKSKYFKVSTRDSNRIKNIKEGMNNLFNIRNRELEEAFLQEATQYAERVLEETRRMNTNEANDEEIINKVFRRSEEEILEKEAEEPEEESETLNSEEVWELNERIQAEDQEEYDRIRAEMEEEEAEANKYN